MAEQVTLYELSDEIKQRLKEKKFLGTPSEVKTAREEYKSGIKSNRSLGQKIRYEKVKAVDTLLSKSEREEARRKSIDLERERIDTKERRNRINMMKG
ncbi:hypothetical protein LCGC14_2377770, partial [marine sediment metagenome]